MHAFGAGGARADDRHARSRARECAQNLKLDGPLRELVETRGKVRLQAQYSLNISHVDQHARSPTNAKHKENSRTSASGTL